jgi:CBS domain-containing protein
LGAEHRTPVRQVDEKQFIKPARLQYSHRFTGNQKLTPPERKSGGSFFEEISLARFARQADNSIKPMKTQVPVSTLLHHKGSSVWHVSPDATVFDAIKLLADKNIGALPVLSNGALMGIITERDYTRKIALQGKSSKDTRVWEIMTKQVLCAAPDESIEECMRIMTENRVRHLPVVEDEKVLGIISIGDLVNWTISAQSAAIDQMEQYIAGTY